MALIDKNIIITPNIGAASDPKIVFSGADAATAAQNITLTAYPTNGGTLSFDGSTGQLFSVTNSMSGTIFSANDVSGIPSIEVIDTGLVKIAQYSGNVLLGTGTDTGLAKLQVTGSLSITGNMLYPSNSKSAYGPNTTWSSYLHVGGDGVNGITRTASIASVVTTNGNLHLDSGSDKAMYLNYYSGTGGVNFGNGAASGITASVSAAGVFNATNVIVNGNQALHAGNYTSYSPTLTGGSASGTWGISVTGNAATTSQTAFSDLSITGAANKYLYINPGNGYEAMVRYNGGSGSGWYVGKRTAAQASGIGTESFHIYSEAAGKTVVGIDTAGTIITSGAIGRTAPAAGFLQGSYNNVGDNAAKSNPIYTIGSSYNPSDAAIGGMYGIGYSNSQFFGANGGSGWGLYVVSNGAYSAIFTDGGAWLKNPTLSIGGYVALQSNNYTSYSPTLTGTGASGTWGINISGNAANATTVGGFTPTASNGVANRVVVADANGYIQNNYFYTSGGGSERSASGLGYFSGHNASDYYIRSFTPAAAATAMGALTTSNYNSYSPTLTGGSASGTWGINVTGNAATLSNFAVSNTANNGQAVANNYIGYVSDYSGTALTASVADGALYNQYYSTSWQHQIYGDFRSGQIALRGKNNGTWQAWRTVWDKTNLTNLNQLTNGPGYTANTGTVTGVTATTPIVSSGGTAPVITHATSGATAGTYNNVTVNTFGHVTAGSNVSYLPLAGGTLTGNVTFRQLFASPTATLSGDIITLSTGAINNSGGSLTIYTTTGTPLKLMVNGGVTVGVTIATTGDLTCTGNITAYSDIGLKTDLKVIPDALNKVKQLTGYTYLRTDSNQYQTGLVAQDVQKVLPEAVLEGEYLSLAYGNMVGLLVEAIKEQQTIIDSQESRIARLETLVSKLIEG